MKTLKPPWQDALATAGCCVGLINRFSIHIFPRPSRLWEVRDPYSFFFCTFGCREISHFHWHLVQKWQPHFSSILLQLFKPFLSATLYFFSPLILASFDGEGICQKVNAMGGKGKQIFAAAPCCITQCISPPFSRHSSSDATWLIEKGEFCLQTSDWWGKKTEVPTTLLSYLPLQILSLLYTSVE